MKNYPDYAVLIVAAVLTLISCRKDDDKAPPAPPLLTITSFSPQSGAVGATVTVTGTNFSTTANENTVTFHDDISATVTAATATTLTVTVPTGAETGKVAVAVNGQNAVSSDDFTVIPPPTITSFSPQSGAVGATVTVTGTNFSTIANENTVTFHDGILATVTTATATALTVTLPNGAETGKVIVAVNGQSVASEDDFTVIPPPTITSFSPRSGAVGTAVTVTGTNFSTTANENTVTFHDDISATVTAATATALTVTLPNGAETGKITVAVNGQRAASEDEFTVIPPPTITSFSPQSGAVGTMVTITGTNFSTTANENTVTFHDDISATVTAATATELTVTVPTGAGTGKVVVAVSGQSAASEDDFKVIPPPTITSFSPQSGAVGTAVTITGTNFSTTANENTVTFHDGILATVTDATATTLTVTVPTGAETGKIAVAINGQLAASEDDFTVTSESNPPPSVAPTTVGFERTTMTLQEDSGTQNIRLTFSQATLKDHIILITIDNSFAGSLQETYDKAIYNADYTITQGAGIDVNPLGVAAIQVILIVPFESTEMNVPLTIMDDMFREPDEKIICTINENPSLPVAKDASSLTITIPASDSDVLWTSYGLQTHETSGTSGVKVFAVDGEDYGDDWMANTHGNRVLKTFEVNASGKHTVMRIIDREPYTSFGIDYPYISNINAYGYAYANENTKSTAIFTTSSSNAPRYSSSTAYLYTMGSHPIYKPAMEEAAYIEKGHVLMISSLENTTTKKNSDGSFSLIFSDDFYDTPLSGPLNEAIAMTGKGLANTVFVGVLQKIPGVDQVVAAAAIKDKGIYQKNAIFTEIVKNLPERDITTSHATPKVAARAADILAANPSMTSQELRKELFKRAPLTEVDFSIGNTKDGEEITEKRMVHVLP